MTRIGTLAKVASAATTSRCGEALYTPKTVIFIRKWRVFSTKNGELSMEFIHVDADVSNPANPDVSESVRVLVDTGATLSVLPSSMLDRLGVQRLGRRRIRSSDGVLILDTGTVTIRYRSDIAGTTAAFGAEDAPPIIGSVAVTSLGFEVDPVNGRLNRVDMLML